MLKVLICAPCPPPRGGIATWVEEIVSANENLNLVDLHFFNTANSKRKAGVYSIWKRVSDGAAILFKQLTTFKAEVSNIRPDIVHIASSGGLSLFRDTLFSLIAKIGGSRVVLHFHFGCADKAYKWFPLSRQLLKLCSLIVDEVFCLDEKIQNMVNCPSKVVINGMSPKQNLFENKKRVITYVGWVIEQKGVFELLEAWVRVNEKNGWKLRIIGPASPENFEKFNGLATSSVEFLGELPRDEVMEHLNESLVFALPSHTEGFPYAILEAMSFRCALLVTDVGGINSVFKYESSPGILNEAGNVDNFTTALEFMISNLGVVKEMGEASNHIYKNYYTSQRMLENLTHNWELLLRSKNEN